MLRSIEHILRSTAAALFLLAALAASSCVYDDGEEANLPDNGEASRDVYVHFRMEMYGSGIPGGTRANEQTTPGTAREDAVNTVDLVVCDAESGFLFDHIPLNAQQTEKITGAGGDTGGVVVPITIPEGRSAHIYAAVNLTEPMRQLFRVGKSGSNAALASSANDYWDVIDEFVPGSAGQQETLESNGGCIPMTGQFTIDGTEEKAFAFDETATKDHPLHVTAQVSRIVAKVHVLAKGDDGYANSNAGEERIGWIRLDDIRYMVNGTNKSSYLFPQPNKTGAAYPWRDPNMDLESYIAGGFDLNMGFDAPAWSKDYVFYNGLSLHKENIAAASHLAKVEAFNQTTFNNTTSGNAIEDRYTKGLYCLENYFDTPADAAAFENYDEAIPMVTHVSVAARLTPQWIVLTADYAQKMKEFIKEYEKAEFLAEYGLTTADFTADDVARWQRIETRYATYFTDAKYLYRDSFRFIKADNEADAADLLNWSLKVNGRWSRNPDDFEHDKYPDGTFYVYNRKYDVQADGSDEFVWTQDYLYLSAGAVATATADNIDIKTYSVPHIGGWGYYYTYLDQLKKGQNRTPYTSSQVTRNTYYLITVGNFGVPGGSTSRPEYIRVNTEPVGWDYDGRGDIDLH